MDSKVPENSRSYMLVRMKIMPEEANSDLDEITREMSVSLPDDCSIRRQEKEPVAFGLKALILDIQAPDEEGMIEKLEVAINGIKQVGNVQILSASRISTKLP